MTRRLGAGLLALTTAAGLWTAGAGGAHAAPKPPPNPTNGQLDAAQNAKQTLATQVGALNAQIAQAEDELRRLRNVAELAEQKAALAQFKLQQAEAAAVRAKKELVASRQEVRRARIGFLKSIQAGYMGGDVTGTTGTLLTARDPSAVLEASALESYLSRHHADAIGQMQQASVGQSNAEANARGAEQRQTELTRKAKEAQQAAFAAVTFQQQRQAALNSSLATTRHELDVAQEQLATLNNQRSVYLAYRAEQARLAAVRAERLRQARLAAERAARARASHHHSGGGGGGGSSGGGWSSGPSAPTGGNWSAAKGKRAVRRAESQLGVPYAWAGGGVGGPSYGVCDSGNGAPNDCNVRGFDCSGLAMFAWGRYWDHYAATQYVQAGSYHPSLGDLRPGDLLFWSDGGVSSIHHVAIYIGGGQIVQAPQSGDIVRISSMWDPGPIFGATRPLT